MRYLRLLSEELQARLERRGGAFVLRQWVEGELGGAPLRFGADENGVEVSVEQMELPQVTSNPGLLQVLDGHAHWLMARPSGEAPDVLAVVSEQISGRGEGGAGTVRVRQPPALLVWLVFPDILFQAVPSHRVRAPSPSRGRYSRGQHR